MNLLYVLSLLPLLSSYAGLLCTGPVLYIPVLQRSICCVM
jgi:hypothetical protein